MGVSQAVAFGLIAMVALSTIASMALIYQKSEDVYDAALESFQSTQILTDETLVKVLNVSVSGEDLFVGITNNGSTNLYDYRHFSVIVDYTEDVNGLGVRSVQEYNYSTTSPSALEWTSLGGILLPSGVGRFEILLPAPAFPGTTLLFVITTNYGPGAEWSGVP